MRPMRQYTARAEFRRRDIGARWVLAGVFVAYTFYPARPGVERLRGRLAGPGLAGWCDLPTSILANDAESAAGIALAVARARWPDRDRPEVPFAAGHVERAR